MTKTKTEETVKAYVIKAKFLIAETAMMNVAARTPEDAAEAAMEMISKHPEYISPEITAVEEYQKPDAVTLQ